jgi:hypothetical protein
MQIACCRTKKQRLRRPESRTEIAHPANRKNGADEQQRCFTAEQGRCRKGGGKQVDGQAYRSGQSPHIIEQ